MANIEKCLEDNVPLRMWNTLHRELRVPPRDTRKESCTLSGVKMWLLFDSTASWQKFCNGTLFFHIGRCTKAVEDFKLASLTRYNSMITILPIYGDVHTLNILSDLLYFLERMLNAFIYSLTNLLFLLLMFY